MSITYQTTYKNLYDRALVLIKYISKNVSDYDNIPSILKSGGSTTLVSPAPDSIEIVGMPNIDKNGKEDISRELGSHRVLAVHTTCSRRSDGSYVGYMCYADQHPEHCNVNNCPADNPAFKDPTVENTAYIITKDQVKKGKLTVTPASNYAVKVSESTVESEFYNYMSSRGVVGKLSNTVTSSGLLHFLNAFSTFCYTKLEVLTSQFTSERVIIYQTQNTYFPAIESSSSETEKIESVNINECLNTILNSIYASIKMRKVNYNYSEIGVGTPISCSSCSSSCSCSSCCSSGFIMFMKL